MGVLLQAWLLLWDVPALVRRATKTTAETDQLQTEVVLRSWVRVRIGV